MLAAMAANISARAQHMNEKDSPCVNTVVTVDLANCLAKARGAADTKLNAAYSSLRGRLDAAERQRLVPTQRLWIQYRERDLYRAGTASSSAYLACLEAMTRARTKELGSHTSN
jgi:uncharacterized protein YecT (DUF1311 family)